jgi:hypothetical protein
VFTILFFSVLLNRDYIWCSLLLQPQVVLLWSRNVSCKPERSRQTVDFMLTDENDGKQ